MYPTPSVPASEVLFGVWVLGLRVLIGSPSTRDPEMLDTFVAVLFKKKNKKKIPTELLESFGIGRTWLFAGK